MVFYAIYDPMTDNGTRVFEDKRDALNMMKHRKEARMRTFSSRTDATQFATYGIHIPNLILNSHEKMLLRNSELATRSAIKASMQPVGPSNGFVKQLTKDTEIANSNSSNSDRPNHRGPKSQELVQFRKLIEQGKQDQVSDMVWKNPRYLIGSGDTPSLLKESCRYNALHVAALARNARMCELLLDTIGDPMFIQVLYGQTNAQHCAETSNILQDLYLNMPERGRNETPLHLAVKFGALDVVDVLTSYAQCAQSPNSDGQMPIDIVCSRVDRDPEHVQQIKALLSGRFYVPVIRSADNSLPPFVGQPFSPKNPPKLQYDPLSPEMEIHAFAGPMNREEAQCFRRRWKTPPRSSQQEAQTPSSSASTQTNPIALATPPSKHSYGSAFVSTPDVRTNSTSRQLFLADSPVIDRYETDKDMNSNSAALGSGSEICDDPMQLSSIEIEQPVKIPHFGDSPTVTQSYGCYRTNGAQMLDDSLNTSIASNASMLINSPMYRERNTKLCDSVKGLETIGRELASQRSVKWREYWPFLDHFVDIRSVGGLKAFEEKLAAHAAIIRDEVAAGKTAASSTEDTNIIKESGMTSLCRALDQLEVKEVSKNDKQPAKATAATTTVAVSGASLHSSPISAHLYAEKSWQVYAKRMTDTLLASTPTGTKREQFAAELRRLRALVCSYLEDERFNSVDFGQAHSRFAHLIVSGLYGCTDAGILGKTGNDPAKLQRLHGEIRYLHDSLAATNVPSNETTCADEDLQCVLANVLHYMTIGMKVASPPATGLTANSARQMWTAEERCRCSWTEEASAATTTAAVGRSSSKTQQQRHLKRHLMNQRTELQEPIVHNDWQSRSLTTDNDDDDYNFEDANGEGAHSSVSDSDDDDVYLTPPETMSPNSPDDMPSEEPIYSNYTMGREPTKTDFDALNALSDVVIDAVLFPHIHQWRDAMQKFTNIERKNFVSFTPLSSLKKNSRRITSTASSALPVKCLFRSSFKPINLQPPPPPPVNPSATINASKSSTPAKSGATTSSTSTNTFAPPPSSNVFGTAAVAAVATIQSTFSSALTIATQQLGDGSTTDGYKTSFNQTSADNLKNNTSMAPPSSPPPPPKSHTQGLLPKIGARLSKMNSAILRPPSFVPSATANACDDNDTILAISPKFALTPMRRPAKPVNPTGQEQNDAPTKSINCA